MRKQTLFVAVSSVFILSLIFALNQYFKIKPHLGSHIPPISFINQYDKRQKMCRDKKTTIVMILSSKCRFCRFQLNVVRKNSEAFSACRLYLLSLDPLIQKDDDSTWWSDLSAKSNIYIGTVDKADVMRHFGAVKIPALFFYDQNKGLFAAKYGLLGWDEMKLILNQSNNKPLMDKIRRIRDERTDKRTTRTNLRW